MISFYAGKLRKGKGSEERKAMMEGSTAEVLDALYTVIENQTSIIRDLSEVLRKQNTDIEQYKAVNGFFSEEPEPQSRKQGQ